MEYEKPELIASWLIHFYRNSFPKEYNNPVRKLLSKLTSIEEVIRIVREDLSSNTYYLDLFDFDLWLNGIHLPSKTHPETKSATPLVTASKILGMRYSGLGKMHSVFIKHFHEADLDAETLYQLYLDSDKKITNTKASFTEEEIEIMSHKNYHLDLKQEAYEKTGDERLLPAAAKDMFLF